MAVARVLMRRASWQRPLARSRDRVGVRGSNQAEATQRKENAGGKNESADGDMRYGKRNVSETGLHRVTRGEHRPVSRASQQKLDTEGDFEVASRRAQIFYRAEARGRGENRPENHEGDHCGTDEVRNDAESVVAKGRAEDNLDENERGSPNSQRAQPRRLAVFEPRMLGGPPFSGEHGERNDGDEEKLGQRGVRRGDRRREHELHGDAAENGLRQDEPNGAPREIAHPAARFGALRPNGQNQGQDGNDAGNDAMAPFPLDAADHGRKNSAESKRPGGNRKRGLIGSDQCTGDNQKKSATRSENGETVQIAVPCLSQNEKPFLKGVTVKSQIVYDKDEARFRRKMTRRKAPQGATRFAAKPSGSYCALKVKSTPVFSCLDVMVMVWSWVPYFSCQASMV